MNENNFKALVVRKKNSSFLYEIEERQIKDLPPGDLLIKVEYSNINFKDLMSCQGNPSITRKYPHTPGIDAVGEVVESNSSDFKEGDKIIVTGYDLGMNTYGGFGQYISIPASWAISLPDELSEAEAMSIGTAGLTAGLCVRTVSYTHLRAHET